MDERLGSLARFAEVEGVHQMDHLIVDQAWIDVHGASPVVVQYDGADSDVIQLSPKIDNMRTERAWAALLLTEEDFMAILVHLIRQGLLENVGLVSTETAAVGSVVGAGLKPAPTEPTPTEEMDAGYGQPRTPADQLVERLGPVADEASVEEDEPAPAAPFPPPVFDPVEGGGDPAWLGERHIMEYLHHDRELSVTDIARVCGTTYARVKGALKRLGIERRSYRGGRSKIVSASAPVSAAQ